MATRDDIIAELMAGETAYKLSKKYPRASVYRIYSELVRSGQIGDGDTIQSESLGGDGGNEYPFIPVSPKSQPETIVVEREEASSGKAGAEVLDFTGPKSLPRAAVDRIRGILGMTIRPKILSCPAPELLYPAMVISVTELGFPPMRPDDFIDTVLYQWLEACDYIPYAFIKKSELEQLAKTYGETEEIIKDEKFRSEHGLVTTNEIVEAVLEPLTEKEKEAMQEIVGDLPEDLDEPGENIDEEYVEESPVPEETTEVMWDKLESETKPEPEIKPESHKPTVAQLLQVLRIENIQKEVENDSAGCKESDSSQGGPNAG